VNNLIVTVMGMKGSGKTTLVRELVAERRKVLIIDTACDYSPKRDGVTVFHEWEAGLRALAETPKLSRYRYALRGLPDECLDYLRVAFELPGVLVVLEEAPYYCSPAKLPAEVARLVLQGRHRSIDQVYVTQRPSLVHRNVTAQSDILVSFAQHEPRDLKYLEQVAGAEFAERVQGLRDFQVAVHFTGNARARCPLPILARLQGETRATAPAERSGLELEDVETETLENDLDTGEDAAAE